MIESFELPNGEKVTFNPDGHIYIVRGKELPSITGLLRDYYGDTYENVNPEILKRAAEYGTSVHSDLDRLINLRFADPKATLASTYQEVQNYFNFVEPIYKIDPIATEKVVVLYDDKNEPIAAGRFDLICTVKGKKALADFKTTTTLHKDLVTGQLNLYLKAAMQSGYIEDMDFQLGAIHLCGLTARFVPVTKLNEDFYLNFIK